ncbi:hypothetical protein OUZ56_001950 [Daphnia magna]|uniref:Secreted protein n=1 Tax=Daphnia magna TaxID=35525 RepID=A0ABR0A483_9CRUS|nr:hypothetical protein OUZ56_001950 [Daphnia magna]
MTVLFLFPCGLQVAQTGQVFSILYRLANGIGRRLHQNAEDQSPFSTNPLKLTSELLDGHKILSTVNRSNTKKTESEGAKTCNF